MTIPLYNDSTYDYNDFRIGYDGGGIFIGEKVDYSVVIRDFKDTVDYAPGDVIAIIPSPHNLGWSIYVNDVGEAFVTVSQDDPVLELIAPHVDNMPFFEIYRNGEKVWIGYLGEVDETPSDVILYGYSLEAVLYWNVSEWDERFADGTTVGEIVRSGVQGIIDATDSRGGWFKIDRIENPATVSDGSTDLTMSGYRLYFKRWLTTIQELAMYAMSDTTNHVIFEISPTGRFSFWKDRNTARSDIRFVYREGYIRNFRRIRKPVDRRAKLVAVGSSPTELLLQTSQTDSLGNTFGMLTEPIFLSFVRDQTELERVTKMRLRRAKRVDSDLYVTFEPNMMIPYRAAGAPFRLGDDITIELPRGISDSGSDTKIAVGQQVVWSRNTETVRLLFADTM